MEQDAHDHWQTQLNEGPYRLSVSVKKLQETNPWPENPALDQAINTLITELWDRGFSQTELRVAFEHAITDLPRYADGEEVRR